MKRHVCEVLPAILAALMLLASCANGGGTGMTETDPVTAVTPAEQESDTQTGSLPPETSGTEETSEPAETTGPEGTYYDPKQLWDSGARAAAIEKLRAVLPSHNPASETAVKVEFRPGTPSGVGFPTFRYLEKTVQLDLPQEGKDVTRTGDLSVTVALKPQDSGIWIFLVSTTYPAGMRLLINIADDFNQLNYDVSSIQSSTYNPGTFEPMQLCDAHGILSATHASIIADKVNSVLASLDPSLSLEVFGIYGRFPETDPRPESRFLFGDSRYRVTVETEPEEKYVRRLKIEDAFGHQQTVSLSGDNFNVFAVAGRLKNGNILMLICQEYLRTDSEGAEKYSVAVREITFAGGELTHMVDGSAIVGKQRDGRFIDLLRNARKASLPAAVLLSYLKKEGTEFITVADFSSGRADSENRFMVPAELPDGMDWKIAKSLGMSFSDF